MRCAASFGLVLCTLVLAPALGQAQLGGPERRCAVPLRARPQLVGGALDPRWMAPLTLGVPALDGLAAVPTSAPDESPEEQAHPARPRVPHLPEPMVFDLVRGLGARQWEVEANSLFMMPIDPDNLHLEWAPEVEVAVADGFALELELPMVNEEVRSLKFAAQLTFGTGFDGHFIHGAQAIVEYELAHEAVETTLLYIAGVELDSTWGLLGMAGVRATVGSGVDPFALELLLNGNLFARVADILVLGMEVNYATDLSERQRLLLMPQAHISIGEHVRWQLGVGLTASGDAKGAVASSRIILEL